MYPSYLTTKRLFAVASALLIAGTTFWLPLRGAAQEGANQQGGMQNVDPNTVSPSGNAANSTQSNASDGNSSSANSDANGDNSIDRNGQPVANPPVGVDTTGRSDATQTRNGRTTRRKPVVPGNPIVFTDSTRGTGIETLPADSQGISQGNRSPLPMLPRTPGDYTFPTDPAASGSRRHPRTLPLFGYDFFQPARQIIRARQRSLLPPRPTRPVNRNGTGSSSRNNSRTSSGGTRAPGNSGTQSSSDSSGTFQGDTSGGSDQSGNGNDQSQYGTDAALAGAAVVGAAAGHQRPNSAGDYGANASDNSADNSNNGNSNNGNQSNDNSNNGNSNTPGSDNSSTGTADTNNANGDTPRRRRPAQNPNDTNDTPYFNGDAFPGDTAVPGGDIQFPGDGALAQDNSTNAVTGQIADPISTLYRNTLGSLPSNYQLQPGDALTVRYSALTIAPREFTATVDIQGGITVPEAGRLSVVGRTATEAEETLRQRLSRLYRNVDVSINLRQLRTIQVTVSGASFSPGTYTVPATATAFNVLNATGGPTANGSLRDIRVLRNGRRVGTLDIYPLIGATSGNPNNRNGDINLQAGDNIYIPARLSSIAIWGQVRQEAIYELTPTETLRDALNYAGGIKPSGVGQTVHIDTTDPGEGRILRDVSVTNRTTVARVPVYDGDTIEVSSVRAILTNRVTILGAVDQPGDYALTAGMRVTDLIQRARGPLYNAYLDQAHLTRVNSDSTTQILPVDIAKALDGDPAQNVALKRFDRLQLFTRQDVAYLGRRFVTVRGEVQRPGLYTQSDNMRVSDLLLETGGPLLDAYLNRAVLLHQRGDGTFAYDYVNLHGVLTGDLSEDKPVQDNDILAVYRIGEAHFTPDHTVKVLGDVVAPGLYARGDNMRLSDLLKLAGAYKPGGGTRVTVAHARQPVIESPTQVAPVAISYNSLGNASLGTDLALQDGDVVAVQGDGSIKDHPAVVTITGAVNRPGPVIVTRNMRLSDAVREAGGLRAEAFPQGAEFTRLSGALLTSGQFNLAQIISQMSDMLNLSQYQRERAKANLALIEAAGTAASGSSSGLAIPGASAAASSTANPNIAPLVNNLSQNNLVSQGRVLTPSQLQPNGSVAVRLVNALKHPGGADDTLIKDGDTLVVPETPTTVQVVGAVFNGSGVVFRPGQSIDYYVQNAGGYTPDAARDRIEIIHAGGGLIPANKAGQIEPGDLILVPTKVLAEKVGSSGNSFNNFFQGLLGSAITFKVLSSVFGL